MSISKRIAGNEPAFPLRLHHALRGDRPDRAGIVDQPRQAVEARRAAQVAQRDDGHHPVVEPPVFDHALQLRRQVDLFGHRQHARRIGGAGGVVQFVPSLHEAGHVAGRQRRRAARHHLHRFHQHATPERHGAQVIALAPLGELADHQHRHQQQHRRHGHRQTDPDREGDLRVDTHQGIHFLLPSAAADCSFPPALMHPPGP